MQYATHGCMYLLSITVVFIVTCICIYEDPDGVYRMENNGKMCRRKPQKEWIENHRQKNAEARIMGF